METSLYILKENEEDMLKAEEKVNKIFKETHGRKIKIDIENNVGKYMKTIVKFKNSTDLFALGRFFEAEIRGGFKNQNTK